MLFDDLIYLEECAYRSDMNPLFLFSYVLSHLTNTTIFEFYHVAAHCHVKVVYGFQLLIGA